MYISETLPVIGSSCFMYADDLKVMNFPKPDPILQDLEAIQEWTTEWDLLLSVAKCNLHTKFVCRNTFYKLETIGACNPEGGIYTWKFRYKTAKCSARCLTDASKVDRPRYYLRKTVASKYSGLICYTALAHLRGTTWSRSGLRR